MAHNGNKKVANSVVAVSSAAVMAVYAAGYTRTRSAAEELEAKSAARRVPAARPARAGAAVAESRPIGREVAASAPPLTALPTIAQAATAPATANPRLAEAAEPSVVARVEPAPAIANAPAVAAPVVSQNPTPAAPVLEQKTAPAAAAAAPTSAAPVAVAPTAAAPVAAVTAATAAPAAPAANPVGPPWKDGTYYGWGTCRHGDLQAAVVIQGGRIASAKISQCETRYSCDVIDILPPQVAQRQSPEIDNVSGATQSADAFYGAVYNALLQAK